MFAEDGWAHASQSSTYGGYYCYTASAQVNYYTFGGGLEVVGTNRSRFVPYALIGMGYASGVGYFSDFGAISAGAPAILAGGGVSAYINHHWGINVGVTGMHLVGSNGGGNVAVPTVGVFFQSK